MENPLLLSVQTLEYDEKGGRLASIEPNPKTGLFHRIPVMCLGKASRNGMTYEINSAVEAMTSPQSKFSINVREGNQEGEWGHPFADKKDLERMVYVDRRNSSHYISGIAIEDMENYKVVYADIGPTGPYGQYLREDFADPNRNVSFSVRAITQPINGNPSHRRIRLMVTFDGVAGPGFENSSKRNMKATNESVEITMTDILGIRNRGALFSQEDITDQQILDMFETNRVRIARRDYAMYDPKTNSFRSRLDPAGRRISATHELLRGVK